MNTNNLPLLIICLFFTATVSAQFEPMYNSNNEVFTENRYSKVKGSPYLFDDWSKGTIYAADGEVQPHNQINFNGQNGKVEVKEGGDKIIALNAKLYNKIEIEVDGQKHVFANRLRGEKDLTYYEVIYGGKDLYFLKKFESDIKEDDVANYGVSKSQNRFVPETRHYILRNGQMEFTPRSKGKILKFFNSSKLKKYVKKEKLNLRDDTDLRKALAYFEGL